MKCLSEKMKSNWHDVPGHPRQMEKICAFGYRLATFQCKHFHCNVYWPPRYTAMYKLEQILHSFLFPQKFWQSLIWDLCQLHFCCVLTIKKRWLAIPDFILLLQPIFFIIYLPNIFFIYFSVVWWRCNRRHYCDWESSLRKENDLTGSFGIGIDWRYCPWRSPFPHSGLLHIRKGSGFC